MALKLVIWAELAKNIFCELAHFVLSCFEGGLIFNFDPRIVEICQKSIVSAQFFDGKWIFTLENRTFQIHEKYMLEKLIYK